jgi:formylglycine-generating enzyme required for sulfatase activity
VQRVNWDDAAPFCNWLSRREGLTPYYVARPLAKAKEKMTDEERRQSQWDHKIDWFVDNKADGYRLPSEAQWEYACRAGATTEFCYGDGQLLLASYAVYAARQASPTGTKTPNGFGLFDMHGNVAEMCEDWLTDKFPGGSDPVVSQRALIRVFRGGSCFSEGKYSHSAIFGGVQPGIRSYERGFRVVAVQSSK